MKRKSERPTKAERRRVEITPELRARIVKMKEDLLLDGKSFTDAVETTARRFGISVRRMRAIALDEDRGRVPDASRWQAQGQGPSTASAFPIPMLRPHTPEVRERAWLLLELDTSTAPPTVLGANIYSEWSPTIRGMSRAWVTVTSASAVDYHTAMMELRRLVAGTSWLAWVRPLMPPWRDLAGTTLPAGTVVRAPCGAAGPCGMGCQLPAGHRGNHSAVMLPSSTPEKPR